MKSAVISDWAQITVRLLCLSKQTLVGLFEYGFQAGRGLYSDFT